MNPMNNNRETVNGSIAGGRNCSAVFIWKIRLQSCFLCFGRWQGVWTQSADAEAAAEAGAGHLGRQGQKCARRRQETGRRAPPLDWRGPETSADGPETHPGTS